MRKFLDKASEVISIFIVIYILLFVILYFVVGGEVHCEAKIHWNNAIEFWKFIKEYYGFN